MNLGKRNADGIDCAINERFQDDNHDRERERQRQRQRTRVRDDDNDNDDDDSGAGGDGDGAPDLFQRMLGDVYRVRERARAMGRDGDGDDDEEEEARRELPIAGDGARDAFDAQQADYLMGDGQENVIIPDANFKAERIIGFKSQQSERFERATGRILTRDDNEIDYLKEAQKQMLARAAAPPPPPGAPAHKSLIGDRQHENIAVKNNDCLLCRLAYGLLPDMDEESMKKTSEAYSQMVIYVMTNILSKDHHIMYQAAANIFNRVQERRAANGKKDIFLITAAETAEHFNDDHTMVIIQKPLHDAFHAQVNYAKLADRHASGVASDGKHFFSAANARAATFHADKAIEYSMRLFQIDMFVQEKVLGKNLGEMYGVVDAARRSGGGAGAAGGGKRHTAIRPMEGKLKNSICK
jgi:hypothetical protein